MADPLPMPDAQNPTVPANAAENSSTQMKPVQSTVEVHAEALAAPVETTGHQAFRGEIQASAGTYGDFSRYLQLLPGVTKTSDTSNDVLVRGGSPAENLYVVDGFEIPNINHLAVEGSSGGFTTMIDTDTIDSVNLESGVYDAQYSSRLSSMIGIETRDQSKNARAGEINFGISGIGGFWERPVGKHANVLLSAHRSLLNLATSNIGLNGVPIYTDGLARFEWSPRQQDHVSVLSLEGVDSINISPCAADPFESLTFDTQYSGSRSTNGLMWQHIHSPEEVSKVTASYSTQRQEIDQQDQFSNGAFVWGTTTTNCQAASLAAVYSESSLDRISSLGYNLQRDLHGWMLFAGETNRVVQLNYAVNQFAGGPSPFSTNPGWTDADSFIHNPLLVQTGSFVEATGSPANRWTMMAGLRMETYSLPEAFAFQPRGSVAFRLNKHQAINIAYRRSSQLAPYIDQLSYPDNKLLAPIDVHQVSAGGDLWRMSMATLSVEAYRKIYSNEPVSTEYPSLMLANMVDTLGQQFIWLPLKTGGRGSASGIELMARGHIRNRAQLLAGVSYARTAYAASDGILRNGNYDVPLTGNGMVTLELPWAVEFSSRDSYASGHPYTPFDIPLSLAQQRGIYDLARVNGMRGPAYNRVDFSLDRNFHLKRGIHGMLNVYGGVQNALNRQNFLGYVWLDRCSSVPICVQDFNGPPETQVYQMPVFPSAGARLEF
ncbi:MAG TPA: TonB-dependent receptor [Terracidiphilus sp.]|nr:TonB-dependent receptor [Terracidiphilus sp.]